MKHAPMLPLMQPPGTEAEQCGAAARRPEAINSNKALVRILRQAVEAAGLPAAVISMIEDTDRAAVREMLRLNGYLDVLIPAAVLL